MAQHDYVIDNGSGSAVRGDINALAEAIVSQNSGTSAPAVTFPFMFWADTTNNVLKQRNSANTAWIVVFNLDGSLPDNSITNGKLRDSVGLSVIGRSANTTGDPADIVGTDGQVLRVSGTTLGFGTVATAGLANNAVDNTKLRQGAALSVIGVTGNATANVADIAAGTDGFVLRRSGTALAFGTLATAGIADNNVTDAKLRQSAGLSIIGRSTNTTGNVADIVGTDGQALRVSGTTLGFGTLATAAYADDSVTNAKLNNMAQNTIKGRVTASTGDPEDLTAAQVKTILVLVKGDVGLGNVDNTSDATKNAAAVTLTNKTINGASNTLTNLPTTALADNSVTDAKLRDSAAASVIGRSAATSGDPADIATSADGDVLRRSGTTLGFGTLATASYADNSVTNAKIADMAANTIKGRITASTGDPEDLTASQVKTILALTKSDVGLGNVDNTSDATYTASTKSFTNTTFNANGTGNVLSNVEIGDFAATSTALSVMGRSANTTGAPADIVAANDGEVLRRSGTAIGFGTLATAALAANIVTNAKLAQMANNTIKGRITAGTGDPEDLTAANVKTILALTKSDVGLSNVDNTSNATERAAAATLTNKTIDAASNTISNIAVSMLAAAAVVTSAESPAANDNDTSFMTTASVLDAIAGAVASGVADGDKGDITVSGSGLTWTVDANAITNSKFRQSAGLSIVGRSANTTGDVADIVGTDGQALRVSGTTLGFGTLATAAYADNSVTDAKLRQSAGLSIVGRSGNTTGNVADIVGTDGQVLRVSGTTLGFGTVVTAGIADDNVTNAKLGNMAANTIKGRITGSTGDPEDLTAANVKTILALTKSDVGLGNVDNTSDTTKFTNAASAGTIRETLTADRIYYVRADGSDANTGLVNSSGGAFLTISKALSVASTLDCRTFNVTIQVGAGTYTAKVSLPQMLGSGAFTLIGDTTTPTNVVISTTSADAISGINSGSWTVSGFKVQTTTGGNGVYALGRTALTIGEMNYGTVAGAHQIYAGSGSSIAIAANYTISGNSAYAHVTAAFGGYFVAYSKTITASGSRAFTIFAYGAGGVIDTGTLTFSGTFTGKRYQAELTGVIFTSGGGASYFPGNTAGSTATGGIYA